MRLRVSVSIVLRVTILLLLSPAAIARARDIDLPAQLLDESLTELGIKAKLNVLFEPEYVRGRFAPAVLGAENVEEALSRLLAGTGLTYRYVGANTLTLIKSNSGLAGNDEVEREQSEQHTQPFGAAQLTALSSAQVNEQNEESATDHLATSEKPGVDEVIVTGTHLRQNSVASPLITVDRTDIDHSGYQTTGELLRSLPQSFSGGMNPGVTGAGGTRNVQSSSGASSANLRGLGSESTLTLINGHRLAYSDITSAVDVNQIPLAAIDRVEVLTDGASAIYGSDAVAGVVNFILRRHFSGTEASATLGNSTLGGGRLQQYSAIAGKDWSSGDALISYEFAKQDAILASQRPFTAPEVAKTTLLPETRRNSFFGAANQSIGENLKLFVQALYTKRSADWALDLSPFLSGLVILNNADVDQYGIATGANYGFGDEWQLSFSVNLARNRTNAPSPTLLNDEELEPVEQEFDNKLRQGELSVNGTLFRLPTGNVGLALGSSFRQEDYVSTRSQGGDAFFDIDANRRTKSLFGEISVPLVSESLNRTGLNSLSVSLAGRYDDYNDFGSTTVPKLGLNYSPVPSVKLKASWGRSFRAPDVPLQYSAEAVYYRQVPDPLAPLGTSLVLIRQGGNKGLGPERSSITTIAASFVPPWLPSGKAELTYFNIDYKDRIVALATDLPPLTTSYLEPFIRRSPTQADVLEATNDALFFNQSDVAYDPLQVAAIVDERTTNAQGQQAKGMDLLLSYRGSLAAGVLNIPFNATYIDLNERLTILSPDEELSGTIFNPSKWRIRTGASWDYNGWTSSGFINYVSRSRNPFSTPTEEIASWATVDLQAGYSFPVHGTLTTARALASVQNALNRDPPFVTSAQGSLPGLNFDSTNASAIGRFYSLQLAFGW